MTYLLDTNVVIHLGEGSVEITRRVDRLLLPLNISLLTWVELEGGVHADPKLISFRRSAIDALLQNCLLLPLTPAIVRAYSNIIAVRGFSRPRVIDRLIAATAIVHDLTLITINAADFRDVPGLMLQVWPAPAQ